MSVGQEAITGQHSESTGGTGSLGAKPWDKLAGEIRSNQDGRGGGREGARNQGGRPERTEMERGLRDQSTKRGGHRP